MWNRRESPVRAAKAAANSVRFEKDTIPDYLRQSPTQIQPGLGWWPPNLRLRRSDLCASCRAIDFEAAFTTPRISSGPEKQWPYIYKRDAQPANEAERVSNCQFCRYLESAVDTIPETGDYTLEFHHKDTYHDHDNVFIGVFPSSGHSPSLMSFKRMPQVSNTIICHRNRPIRKAGQPQIVPPVYDVSLAQSWLKSCRDTHTVCHVEDDAQIPKTRLIDCFTRTLVSTSSITDPKPSFVALSYVWGPRPSEPKEPENQKDQLPRNLPLTIEDAITVTKDLGFKYLWVDQYCIDQEDEADKESQISQMDLIYKSADLTIIAAGGDSCQSGLPGVSAWRRDILDPFVLDDVFTFGMHPPDYFYQPSFENGSWHTRGWTFQEGLFSRRLLVFSDTAMHYECKGHECEAWQCEMSGGVECEDYDASRTEKGYYDRFPSILGPDSVWSAGEMHPDHFGHIPHRGFVESFFTYIRLATRYTTKSLSHAKDGLNAFRGAANALQNFRRPVFNIIGIPFVVSKNTKMAESLARNSFLRGLEWQSGSVEKAPSLEFPSWSWANVRVWEVIWTWDNKDVADQYDKILSDAIDYARDMKIEFDFSNGNKELHAIAEFAKACRNPTHFNQFQGNATALRFKSRILSSSFASQDHICDYETVIEAGKVYSDLGDGVLEIAVHVDVASTQQQGNESGRADQFHGCQTICSTGTSGERLYAAMASEKYGLVLLRFNDWDASVLLVEWVSGKQNGHQRTARRVGICVFEHSGAKEGDRNNPFLRCFSSDIDLRLV